ncbi:MAG TPA: M48 family metallopeptidase [Candidatus Acidoferrum sp.]|nr:M48 family metallopeptidase [Candidatus Acidoferrum sp.]
MNFFEQQDRARASTFRLVALFVFAIATLVLVTSYLAVMVVNIAQQQNAARHYVAAPLHVTQLMPEVALVIISVVLLGALYRTAQLRSGGKAVAEQMGGRLLHGNDASAEERKILNVVEEMAIASGVPVPPVYVIEDDAINAFAAGYHPQDAVIGITRGAVHLLSRDELQGVIAHEFSHIFNGDMRLNLRLIGWLHGLLLITLIGRILLQAPRPINRDRDQTGNIMFMLGLLFIVLGYAGVLFGNLIKSAVSRQREFLADASSVQFTRNPDGIGNALKKIGGYSLGSRLMQSNATEIGHLLFGEGVYERSSWLFATHPPLEERIRRIDPQWDGKMLDPKETGSTEGDEDSRQSAHGTGARDLRSVQTAVLETAVVTAIGAPTDRHLSHAVARLAEIPDQLREQLATPLDASLLLCALPVARAAADTARQELALLQQQLSSASYQQLTRQLSLLQVLPRELDQTLLELAQPALRQLSPAQWQQLNSLVQQLADVDGELSVQECTLLLLMKHYQGDDRRPQAGRLLLVECRDDCVLLLSVLARAGNENADEAAAAFAAGWNRLQLPAAAYQPAAALAQLEPAIKRLAALRPLQKPALLKAMVCCVQNDGKLAVDEIALLRTVAALLDCPLPPLA